MHGKPGVSHGGIIPHRSCANAVRYCIQPIRNAQAPSQVDAPGPSALGVPGSA